MKVQQIDESRWRILREGMRVDGIVYATAEMMEDIRRDKSLAEQVANVAHLPGIVRASLAMPDIHWGYGFPIGGVAGMDAEEGVMSPGGVGYDINCGVRLVAPTCKRADVGLGSRASSRRSTAHSDRRGAQGASSTWPRRSALRAAAGRGVGGRARLRRGVGPRALEESGCFDGAEPRQVSERARERGADQLGTLGSGNHFAELQYVDEIYDDATRPPSASSSTRDRHDP